MNKVFESTTKKIFLSSWVSVHQAEIDNANVTQLQASHSQPDWKFIRPLRNWLDDLKVSDRQIAHRLCKYIPAQCPFERDVKLFGKVLFHIPPMCKLNPVYEEVVGLRFRAMCYLADECGEDISQYC
ncbi:Mo-dependent nitrogenase C-terminal domain-containing protein [Anabaena cylindrica FACHB-243]|uniref:Mo-dependent nitrogenase family protein n=1 Tax=Anabaena cylindrica (strain ATCC 27899 / PCC 7122) TaxID=272123 RepID=K9ZNW2_ANACC|nr:MULTISPECIES: Mo-dependent nitrogenase C-terminal domain-containing protein [Anabaena]AFZ60891.1 Mo-dependent nitrogenase family protein [Anabaena cylindrica PCC 7122]MBD2420489.1 Mo-dependent nitrogenase C-terminal domain-containing protein [Anabaena cylindrica FACHB-243]MBY5285742.1 nitrogenase [Anabaena sp. CCAP 1446/1C]MBY5309936.1 nitrogenase [Anabaena sp. CCAP 1446/1C]MCM2406886.1 Mo-dependent nitrogenase C-terminal domain-containing protein [Anabaena sp. CCAP 1446/1C]